jgi:hypothetical protein
MLLLIFSFFSVNINIIRISMAQATHDIAVTSVTPSTTSVIAGELVNITVVVENQGTEAEGFTVTLYYDTTTIETKPVTNLAADLNTTLVFMWDTTDRKAEIYTMDEKEKTYAIKAVASTVPDEADTQDNTSSPIEIRVVSQYIAVIPQRTVNFTITSGMNYTVAINTDYNGTDIWSWQFTLSYNPLLLEGIEVSNGDLITTAKHPNAVFMKGAFNNTKGELGLTAAYFEVTDTTYDTTNGPGTMAYVTFKVKGTGESNITLVETRAKLLGPSAAIIIDDLSPSLGHILYGYFRNTETVIHDIAVISVTPSLTSVIVGEPVNITVVVENQGTETETFDVKVYYDYDSRFPANNVIGTKTGETLAADASKTLNFTWDTTNTKPGNYTVTAVVSKVSGEIDTSDNTVQSDTMVTVKAQETTPLPITAIIIGIVIIVAVIAAIALVRRRKKKPLPEEV